MGQSTPENSCQAGGAYHYPWPMETCSAGDQVLQANPQQMVQGKPHHGYMILHDIFQANDDATWASTLA